MALDPSALGFTTEPLLHEYTWQDVVLYNLSIGARRDTELHLLFEGADKAGPVVFPTYAVIPAWPAMLKLFDAVGGDMLGIVHGGQSVTLHKPFAPQGRVTTVGRVAGVYDLKRLAQTTFVSETRDESGELLCETSWDIIFRLDGGFGGEKPPKAEKVRPPERDADFVVQEATRTEQALLYRLTGDHNPLHADPAIGEKAGFGQPILHGLCTFGHVARHVVNAACGGDASRLRRLEGQFRKPVWPGDTLVTSGWQEGDHLVVEMRTLERPDDAPFSNARAFIDPA
ncbi:MAG: MaoC family dehydratase N-terminal domain-containing protein [Sandaracinaceae bacterium]|nr:MaoC family dehydratase N-terminal domain-containing protein [Sandaracinaceae bacterium]